MDPQAPAQAHTSTEQPMRVQNEQPIAMQSMSMDNTKPQTAQETEQENMRLRGGEMCPGRFCFIIPCPIPCNFCII